MHNEVVNAGESREDQIVAAYANGEDVRSIAARFGSDPREIEHIVAVIAAPAPPPSTGPGRFNPPPGWPPAPAGWFPPPGWRPDNSWPPPPAGWQFIVDDAAPPRPEPAAGEPDLIDQLRRLGELRDAGIVTEEEFAAKKADILSRL